MKLKMRVTSHCMASTMTSANTWASLSQAVAEPAHRFVVLLPKLDRGGGGQLADLGGGELIDRPATLQRGRRLERVRGGERCRRPGGVIAHAVRNRRRVVQAGDHHDVVLDVG